MMRGWSRRMWLAAVTVACSASVPACTKDPPKGSSGSTVPAPPSPQPPLPPEEHAEDIFAGGLKNEWQDWGWCPRTTQGPGPASLHFAKWGGWILAKQSLKPG